MKNTRLVRIGVDGQKIDAKMWQFETTTQFLESREPSTTDAPVGNGVDVLMVTNLRLERELIHLEVGVVGKLQPGGKTHLWEFQYLKDHVCGHCEEY